MLFNSFEYFAFFVAVLTVSWLTTGFASFRTWFLLGASLYFYASNNGWQTLLILLTTTIDYFVCLRMGRTDDEARRKALVIVSVVSNLGLLAWFKYANFAGQTASWLAEHFGIQLSWVTLNIVLPVGISFYTFEALSYTIDVYRRRIDPERKWHRLAFLVTFFPHLIAGPIVRAADFFPQMRQPARLTRPEVDEALLLIARGLVKKIVFADTLAAFADAAFSQPQAVGTAGAWLGVYAFSFQIYFDFSGYTDIALGCAKLLGYQLPENFRRPYAATSVTEFWRRWHISLSTWLRDYLYVSLGGNRMKTRWGVYRNLMITMLLGGLWHGAAWTFVFWGFLHGAYLSIERAFGVRGGEARAAWSTLLRAFVTFHVVTFTWIPFRARDLTEMKNILVAMFTWSPGASWTNGMTLAALVMAGAWLLQVAEERWDLKAGIMALPLAVKGLAFSVVASLVLVLGSETPKAFIYFRF